MEETKIVEATKDVVVNANGNLKVVLITAAATAALTAGGIYAVNQLKKASKKRKLRKTVKATIPETETVVEK